MVWKRDNQHQKPRGVKGAQGPAGPAGPKGERGEWPAQAFDLLQSQMDDLRREIGLLSERVDELTERLARNDSIRKRSRQ